MLAWEGCNNAPSNSSPMMTQHAWVRGVADRPLLPRGQGYPVDLPLTQARLVIRMHVIAKNTCISIIVRQNDEYDVWTSVSYNSYNKHKKTGNEDTYMCDTSDFATEARVDCGVRM